MTEDRIEELADEITAELSAYKKGIGIEDSRSVGGVLEITFSWEQPPFYIEVSIDPRVFQTDTSVQNEIRRQLSAVGLLTRVTN